MFTVNRRSGKHQTRSDRRNRRTGPAAGVSALVAALTCALALVAAPAQANGPDGVQLPPCYCYASNNSAMTITALSSNDVAAEPWYIEIYELSVINDQPHYNLLASCATGSTCSATQTHSDSVHTYVAYIAGLPRTLSQRAGYAPPPNIQATSSPMWIQWIP